MPYPRVFISSTYVDLADVRSSIIKCFKDLKAEPVAFERGGISYDHSSPLDLSCYDSVKDCDMMVLIIGGRYGKKVSNNVDSSNGKTINSITKAEYLEAISARIKVLTFIKDSVMSEYYTYRNQPKNQRKNFKPATVDDVAIFELIYEIKQLIQNNVIIDYHTVNDITDKLQQEFALLAQKALKTSKEINHGIEVHINAYKMFYFRRQKGLSLSELAALTRLKRNLITSIENVKSVKKADSPNEIPFRKCRTDVLNKIEIALGCKGTLSIGQDDDMLSQYVNYYHCNRNKRPTRGRTNNQVLELFPKKAIVLDFDGTLTTRKSHTTWEMLWVNLGYSPNECNFYHRQYSNGLINHSEWCRITCEKFKEKGLSEKTLIEVASSIKLIDGVKEFIEILEKNDIQIHILSGSVDQIIKLVLGTELYNRFTHVQANSFQFTNKKLSYIKGTKYDFEGKAEYINQLIKERGYSQTDILFVGNSSNDRWASRSGVATVCVNPHFTDGNDEKEWIYCIREMESIMEVLKYIPMN